MTKNNQRALFLRRICYISFKGSPLIIIRNVCCKHRDSLSVYTAAAVRGLFLPRPDLASLAASVCNRESKLASATACALFTQSGIGQSLFWKIFAIKLERLQRAVWNANPASLLQ